MGGSARRAKIQNKFPLTRHIFLWLVLCIPSKMDKTHTYFGEIKIFDKN